MRGGKGLSGGPSSYAAAVLQMLRPGNLPLGHRPLVLDPGGRSISTVRSMSFGTDGKEILVPTAVPPSLRHPLSFLLGGRILSPQQAEQRYFRTGENLGTFANAALAERYANLLHEQQAAQYRQRIMRALGAH